MYFKESNEFVVGKKLSLADVYLAVILAQVAMVTLDTSPYPALHQWWRLMRTRREFNDAHREFYALVSAAQQRQLEQRQPLPILYYHPLSPPSRTVHYFAAASGTRAHEREREATSVCLLVSHAHEISCHRVALNPGIGLELRIVNLQQGEQHSPEYRKINPFGKVPALDDSGFLLYEVRRCHPLACVCVCAGTHSLATQSSAVIRYLAAKYDSWLYPVTDARKQAQIDVVVEKVLALLQCTSSNARHWHPPSLSEASD